MIDDPVPVSDWHFDNDEIAAKQRDREYKAERKAASVAALNLCPDNIKEWLISCSPDSTEPYSYKDPFSGDMVEWFEVGFNATHYFSLGVRADGILIKKISGPEYDEECQCWHDQTTVRIIEPNQASQSYWGHRQPLGKSLTYSIIKN